VERKSNLAFTVVVLCVWLFGVGGEWGGKKGSARCRTLRITAVVVHSLHHIKGVTERNGNGNFFLRVGVNIS
jgi:hypothetical protein